MSLNFGWGRSPRGGDGNPLKYSCLENPMDRGAWQATVHRFAELDTAEMTEHWCIYIYIHIYIYIYTHTQNIHIYIYICIYIYDIYGINSLFELNSSVITY